MSSKRIPITVLDKHYDRGYSDGLTHWGPDPGKCTIWEPQIMRMYLAGFYAAQRDEASPFHRVVAR